MHSLFKISIIRLFLVPMLLSSFIMGDLINSLAYADVVGLPMAGTMVKMSNDYSLPVLKGLKVNPQSPFELNFIVDANDQGNINKEEANKLISYFMAALTIDKENIWVNLSPYEQERITDPNLAVTDLGKDLLKQDYILKQLSASLTHPESKTGQEYWNNEYANSDLSKIWIVPEQVNIYEKDNQVFVTKMTFDVETQSEQNVSSSLVNILDEVREDVNNGENFANLRQIFHSIALAQWFKAKLQDSVFKHYINQNKVSGIELDDKAVKDKIWAQYVDSFNKGAYNTVAKVKDSYSGRIQKQKYFCGGIQSSSIQLTNVSDVAELALSEDVFDLMMRFTDQDGVYWGDAELSVQDDQLLQVTEEVIDELVYTPAQKTNAKVLEQLLNNDIVELIKEKQPVLYDQLIAFENPLLFEILISNVELLYNSTESIYNFFNKLDVLIDQYVALSLNKVDQQKAEAAYLLMRNKNIVDANLPDRLIVMLRDNHDQVMQGLMFEHNKQLVEGIAIEAKKFYNASFKFQNSPEDIAAITAEIITQSLEERKVISSNIFTFFMSEKSKALSTLKNPKSNLDDFVKALKLSFDRKEMEDKARQIISQKKPRLEEVSRAISNYILLEGIETDGHPARLILENSTQEELKLWLSVKNPEFLRMLAREYPMVYAIDKKMANEAYAAALMVVDDQNNGYLKAMDIISHEAKRVLHAKIESDNLSESDIKAIDVIGIELTARQKEKVNRIETKFEVLDFGTEINNFLSKNGLSEIIEANYLDLMKRFNNDAVKLKDFLNKIIGQKDNNLFYRTVKIGSHKEQRPSNKPVSDPNQGWSVVEELFEEVEVDDFGPKLIVSKYRDFLETALKQANSIQELNDIVKIIDTLSEYNFGSQTISNIFVKTKGIEGFDYSQLSKFVFKDYRIEIYDTVEEARGFDYSDEYKEKKLFKTISKTLHVSETFNPVKPKNYTEHGSTVTHSYTFENSESRGPYFDVREFNKSLQTLSSNVELVDAVDPFGGIDAQGLDIKTDAMSSSIEFKAFDPNNFEFAFVISQLNRVEKKTVLASL